MDNLYKADIMTKTMKLYQAGLTRQDAIKQGANASEFDRLVGQYKDGSIPAHVIHGFKASKPYSCEYHTGGQAGAKLREIIRGISCE